MFQQEALIHEMGRLRKFAMRLTKNTHNAEDLLQSTMLRALEKKDYFQDETNLFSWTSTIMFNIFISGYRHAHKFETQYDPTPYIDRMSVGAPQESYTDLVTVNESIKKLSQEHRQILLLICVEGLSYEETALMLKIPMGTVRSRLSRARSQLQDILTPVPFKTPHILNFPVVQTETIEIIAIAA
jgi:RNA polymerase sigma-70 factor (ECF subfamily)